MLSRAQRRFAVFFCVMTLSACGTPLPPVDQYQVSVTPETSFPQSADLSVDPSTSQGLYRISGSPGSAPANATIKITNLRTFKEVIVASGPDGSFAASIEAIVNDRLQIMVYQGVRISQPSYVYVGQLNIKNPYTRGGHWYVGQVHLHTTNSDGKNTPAQIELGYRNAGYDFLVSTDHRGTSPYFIGDDDGLTPDPDNSATGADLLWIRGAELGFGGVHMGVWGPAIQTPMLAGDNPTEIQWRIDHVRANGGLAVINHPHNEDPPYAWDWYRELIKVKRYSFIEAFNGKHAVSDDGTFEIRHIPSAIDLADEFQQVWWIGADDCHDMYDSNQFNRYAIVVQTDSAVISQQDVLAAADAGNMYIRQTAQGPAISSVSVEGNRIVLRMEDVDSLYDVIWKKRGDEMIQENPGVDTMASYPVNGDEGYVRAEIKRRDDGKYVYTQPLFVANNVDLASSVSVSSGNGAGSLLDNNRSTYWDAQANTASFVIDMGSVRLVNAVKIDWYAGDTRRFNYRIETSGTGAFTGEQKEVVRQTYSNRLATTLDFFDEMTRYVKVTVTSQSVGVGSTVRVSEVQVFDASPSRTELFLDNEGGSDNNSGLSENPWRTFNHAKTRVRPRDTLNIVPTGAPYSRLDIGAEQSGRHRNATIVFRGQKGPGTLTEVNATGQSYGILVAGASFVEWMYFDVHSAVLANAYVTEGSSDVSLMYNKLHNGFGQGLLGAGKYLFAYNLVYANGREGALIVRDRTEARIYNNVFYGNGEEGLQIDHYYQSVPVIAEVMNNISAGNAAAGLLRGSVGTITDAHNCVDGGHAGPWQQTGSLNVAPLFINPLAGDFRLQGGSPCIDAGREVNLTADFLGNAPYDAMFVPNRGDPRGSGRDYVDIGAYEYID